jgi:iron complex transport system substrate-binding protein
VAGAVAGVCLVLLGACGIAPAAAGGPAPAPPPAPAPASGQAAGGERPLRVVSLDYCADQYVLGLADRSQIAALSPDAAQDFSYHAVAAQGLPRVRPRTEDILALRPDLVVRAYGGGPALAGQLERLGVPVHQLGFGEQLADIRTTIRSAGAALGQAARAGERIAQMDARLAAAASAVPAEAQPRALYLTASGFTSGRGSMVHEMMQAAGLANAEGGFGWRSLPLEELVSQRPQLVVTAFFGTEAARQDVWSVSRHGVVREMVEQVPRVDLPAPLVACGGWWLADGVEAMAAAARSLREGPPS